MERYVCLHGHFYQPPRENPWLEAIELQDSAYPYHDWNERITAECYTPNGASRILGESGRIEQIVNNYSRISFNFGPTLLSWLAERAPQTYAAVLDADRESQGRFSGHGCATAQVYNHMILPLATERDRHTQVIWGIADFEHRFGRRPEGMWLPETAVDEASLEALAEQGIAFTILAPGQARRVRRIGGRGWHDVSGARIDPSRAYRVNLPSGRSIAVFFYDGPVSHGVAFEGLLSDGRRFAERLLDTLSDERDWPQLGHIATDGESYGHHHHHGDMALAYALHTIEEAPAVTLTIYGEFLERHPPTHEVELFTPTAWSCVHGVGRWYRDCSCNTGHAGWNQEWRTPLRDALDWLRDALAPRFEEKAGRLLEDPWAARDDYIRVVLDRSLESQAAFFTRHARQDLAPEDRVAALELLELQRHAMLMYTSCGWFFDELSGIETVQVIQYAGRALQLAERVLGADDLEAGFLERLSAAKSNLPEHGDGQRIYEKFVRPAMVDLKSVAAHYAISSLFESYADKDRIYCYAVDREDAMRAHAGRRRLLVGRARITSEITGETANLSYGVLHFGDHNIQAGVREYRGTEAYDSLVQEASEAFVTGDLPATVRVLDHHFAGVTSSLRSLFRDEQRKVIGLILETTLADAESTMRQIYEHHAPILRFLAELGTPAPRALHNAAEFALNSSIGRALAEEEPDLDHIRSLLSAAELERVALDTAGLGYAMTRTLERLMESFARTPEKLALLQRIQGLVRIAVSTNLDSNLWRVQNQFHELMREIDPRMRDRQTPGATTWMRYFTSLGELLGIHVGE